MNLHDLLRIQQNDKKKNQSLQNRISPQNNRFPKNNTQTNSNNYHQSHQNYPPKPKPPQYANNNRQPPAYQQKRQAPSYERKNNNPMNQENQNQQRQQRYSPNNFQENQSTNYQPRRQDNFHNNSQNANYQGGNYQGRQNFQKNNPINQGNVPPPPSHQQPRNKNYKKNYNDNNNQSHQRNNSYPDRNSNQTYRGRGRGTTNYQNNTNNNSNNNNNKYSNRPVSNNFSNNQRGRGSSRGRGNSNYQQKTYEPKKTYKKEDPIEEQEEEEEEVEEVESQEEYQDEDDIEQEEQEQQDLQQEEEQGGDEEEEDDDLQYSSVSENQEKNQTVRQPLVNRINDDGQMKAIDQMCGKQQFQERVMTFSQNNKDAVKNKLKLDTSRSFSIFQINKKTFKPDLRLTLKRFRRSANREQDNNEEDNMNVRRSVLALQKTITHINNEIIDGDRKKANDLVFPMLAGQSKIQFIQIYEFLWDRMRQMIKDITRLNQEQRMQQSVVLLCEEMARFFILAINQGRKKYESRLQFDEKMNKQSLIKVLTPLMEIYITSRSRLKELIFEMKKKNSLVTAEQVERQMRKRKIFISPNEPEMTCYAILISQDYRKYIYENICAGFQNNQDNPLYNSYEIKQALQIQNALRTDNSEKFFRILQSQDSDYVLSSLMLHHVHWVRTKVCKKIFETFKFFDGQGTRKGILSSDLKIMLRFKQKQNYEFSLFLRSINVSEVSFNSSNYLIENQGEPDEENYKMPQFIFQIDKTDRNLYTDEVPDLKRPVIDMENTITRQEIVKRDWFESTYVQQIIASCLGEEFEGKRVVKVLGDRVNSEEARQVEREKQEQRKKTNQKLQEMRAVLKQKKKRGVFIKNLEDKLISIFRKQQTKKVKMAHLFELLEKKIKKSQIQFFDALQFNMIQQQQEEQTLLRMHEHIKNQKKFKDAINRKPYQFTQKTHLRQNKNMSQMLDKVKRKNAGVDPQIKNFLQKQLMEARKIADLQTFKIKLFHSSKVLNNGNYQKILEKLISQILGVQKVFQAIDGKKYTFQGMGMQNILQIQAFTLNKKNYSKVFGANCILFVGVDNQFINQIKQLMDFYGSVKRMVKQQFNIPLGMFTFIVFEYFMEKQTLPIDFQDTSFLIPSLHSLNLETKNTLRNLLQLSINNFLTTQHPKIEGVLLGNIIKELQSTLKYLKIKIETQKQSFLLYQQYINMCFEKLAILQKNYFKNFQMFENWIQVLNDIGEDDEMSEKNIDNLKYRIKNEYESIYNFVNSFQFSITQAVYKQNHEFTHDDLLNYCMKNLMRFDMEAQGNSRIVSQRLKMLQILDGRIYGDAYPFFKYFLYVLSLAVQNFWIILPQNFSFRVDFSELMSVFEQKRKYKRGKTKPKPVIEQVFGNLLFTNAKEEQKNMVDHNIYKRNKSISGGFVYERSNWLQECRKKVQINL